MGCLTELPAIWLKLGGNSLAVVFLAVWAWPVWEQGGWKGQERRGACCGLSKSAFHKLSGNQWKMKVPALHMPSFSWLGLKAFQWLSETESGVPGVEKSDCLHKGRWWIGTQESALLKRVCSLRDAEVLGTSGDGLKEIIVYWTTCLEKRKFPIFL